MCVVNGRFDHEYDNFTCRTSRGLSVVDYFIAPHSMLPSCYNFHVIPCLDVIEREGLQTLLSRRFHVPDHNILRMEVSINVQYPVNNQYAFDYSQPEGTNMQNERSIFYDLKKMPNDFMTSESCVQNMLKVIEKIECNREEQTEIDDIYQEFTETIVS